MRREEANHSRPTPGHIGRVETALPRPDGRGHVRRGHEALAPGIVQPQCKSAVLKKSPLEKRKAKKGTRRLGDWGGLQMTKWCLEPNSDSLSMHARWHTYYLLHQPNAALRGSHHHGHHRHHASSVQTGFVSQHWHHSRPSALAASMCTLHPVRSSNLPMCSALLSSKYPSQKATSPNPDRPPPIHETGPPTSRPNRGLKSYNPGSKTGCPGREPMNKRFSLCQTPSTPV